MTYFWQNPLFQPNPTEHYPFKRRAKIGPGPLQQTNAQVEDWDCACHKYKCVCDGISDETVGRRKVIQTDPDRKRAYNKMYREWRKQQRRR
jgi:hypothetical protein